MQVERVLQQCKTSGKRERNTLVTYLEVVNNSAKAGLISDNSSVWRKPDARQRRKPVEDEPAHYQLVGRVMAYQGYDG